MLAAEDALSCTDCALQNFHGLAELLRSTKAGKNADRSNAASKAASSVVEPRRWAMGAGSWGGRRRRASLTGGQAWFQL